MFISKKFWLPSYHFAKWAYWNSARPPKNTKLQKRSDMNEDVRPEWIKTWSFHMIAFDLTWLKGKKWCFILSVKLVAEWRSCIISHQCLSDQNLFFFFNGWWQKFLRKGFKNHQQPLEKSCGYSVASLCSFPDLYLWAFTLNTDC